MWAAVRVVVAAFVFLSASVCVKLFLTVVSSFLVPYQPIGRWEFVRSLCINLFAFSGAAASAYLAWKRLKFWGQKSVNSPPRGALATAGTWSLVAGVIGLVGGTAAPFLYAFLFDPTANPIPLVGILFTGPLGFIFGGIAGLVRGALRQG